jgi:mRNA interferase MazF
MPSYSFGEVLILPFTYADLESRKRRPAVVIVDSGDTDVLVAKITTKQYHSKFDLEIDGWREAGLLAPSIIRVHKMLAVEKAHILQQIGRLQSDDIDRLRVTFRQMV